MPTTILGLSGGVDSALAARLLLDAGHDVVPLYLDLDGSGTPESVTALADALGLRLYTRDVSRELDERVCAAFAAAYLAGQTPIPCVLCNQVMKFPALFDLADALGAEYVATGHYARMGKYHGAPAIMKSPSPKDQSYMLCRLERAWLPRLLFPLEDFPSKDAVRDSARHYGIPAADTPDSQDICFVPDGDYAAFIERRGFSPAPGKIVDEEGRLLGLHSGIHHYTVGQRRGLGVAAGERVYVSRIDVARNEVVLARGSVLMERRVAARDCRLLSDHLPERVEAKVRYSAKAAPARVLEAREGGPLVVEFDDPVRAVAPGQSLVLYDGDVLLGGGVLTR